MIISPGRNFIFVHIPKTGGTSLALALEERAHRDDILIGDTPKAKRRRRRLAEVNTDGRLWKHSTLADINGLVSLDFVRTAFCVTLVRNPWDRIVSYYHWLRVQRFKHPAVETARALGFSDFLQVPEIQNALSAAHYASYMTAADGEECAQAYIRLEHFESDAAPFWDHLGFRLSLPHENASDRDTDYRGYYSQSEADLVARLCQADIQRFGYQF